MRHDADSLAATEEIGEVIAASLAAWFAEPANRATVEEFRALGLNFGSAAEKRQTAAPTGVLGGMSLVVTGTLSRFKRDEIEELIRDHGGKASSSVSKRTDYLVAGARAGSKLAKAEKAGVPVLTEEQFAALVGLPADRRPPPTHRRQRVPREPACRSHSSQPCSRETPVPPALLLCLASVVGPPQPAAAAPNPWRGAGFIRIEIGELPIILSAPHGGTEPVPGVPERTGAGVRGDSATGGGFVTVRDVRTDELAALIADGLERRTGRRPSLVIARFSRKYVDANRDRASGVEHALALPVHDRYHRTLDDLIRRQGRPRPALGRARAERRPRRPVPRHPQRPHRRPAPRRG